MARLVVDSDSDDDYLEDRLRVMRKAKQIRPRTENFEEWDEEAFCMRYRITKETALLLLTEIEEHLEYTSDRNSSLNPANQLLLTLRFYATGGMQTTIGDCFGVSKSTTSRIVTKVSGAIASLRPQFVRMPETQAEIIAVQQGFYRLAAFPRVVGTVDCTHVRIISPGGNAPEEFRNRKGYFSVNVQTVSDAELNVRDIVARWPGSVHDSTIFNNSTLKARFMRGDYGNGVLLGDSGYAPTQFLLPPLRNPVTEEQNLFNESLIRTRNTVERQYGVMKRRFPVLALGIRLHLETVEAVIVACAVMHNIALQKGEEEPPQDPELEDRVNAAINDGVIPVENQGVQGQDAMRETFINYFRNLL
ncbi:putative nuclease HARBI1 [Bacillus rossius redtenbacheri]|uniref:putative nuclease HARBI1 n=1 Tax=Bacillus rossius redtenbacheri TaxID=93214 RepID=UPI002FDE1CE4